MRLALMLVIAVLGACASPSSTLSDDAGLITVTRTIVAGDVVTLSVTPARRGLSLNAKSPPRFSTADGVDQLLSGPVDADGEKFTQAATAQVVAAAGTLRVSVCDDSVGICRTAEVQISE